MAAFPIADLTAILARATPGPVIKVTTLVKRWIVVLAALCVIQLMVIVAVVESIYLDETGPMLPVATTALNILVEELAETRHTTKAAVWQELAQRYRFDNPMALSRRDGRHVLEGVTAALVKERSTPPAGYQP